MRSINFFKLSILSFCLTIGLASCSNDDNNSGTTADNGTVTTSADLKSYYSATPTPVSTPPSSVLSKFNSEYPSAQNVSWNVSNNVYRASFTGVASKSMTKAATSTATNYAWYKKDGSSVQNKVDILISQLPDAIKNAITAEYPGAVIDDAEMITRGSEVFYEVEFEVGRVDYEFYYTADGQKVQNDSPANGVSQEGLQAAKADFATRFAGARDVEWEVYSSVIKVEFELGNDDDQEAYYSTAGVYVDKTKKEIYYSLLPQAVKTAVETEFNGTDYQVDDVYQITTSGVVSYAVIIEIENGREETEHYIEFDADGTETKRVTETELDD